MPVAEKRVVLRAYVYERHGVYHGECIDLDLMVKRETLEDALAALEEAVAGYVHAAASQGWFDELVPRKSPWINRLLYHLRTIQARVLRSLLKFVEADQVVTLRDGQVSIA